MRVEATSGLSVSIDDGRLTVAWGEPDWLGPGAALGASHHGWDGAQLVDGDATWTVESRDDVVVLTTARRSAATGLANGSFAVPTTGYTFEPKARATAGAPEGLVAFGFQYTEFALPTRAGPDLDDWWLLPNRPPVVEPLLLVAPDLRTILLAPIDAFHDQVIAPPNAERPTLLLGWHGDLDAVPAGFTTSIGVIAARDPAAAIERWVAELRGPHPPSRPGPYADVLGSHLSYWTDNGAAYWYKTAPDQSARDTIVRSVDALRAQGISPKAVQLDSWWYPHQVLRPFNTEEWVVPPTGLLRWEPRDDVFPDGIVDVRAALGDPPLVTHIRHLSAQSDYLDTFDCWIDGEQAHPKHADYYEALLDQAQAWGVEVFEHDWLVECFVGVRGLREAPGRARAWQEGIDAAAGARGMTLQWCMPTPADLMQTTTLRNVTSIRTSGDHGYLVGPGILWAWFCYVNVIARALGLWPFKDVFRTDHDRPDRALIEALLSAMSGGPVGIGDRVGETDASIVAPTCRRDGLLIKPDVPIAAIGRSFARHAVMSGSIMVATTWSDHPIGRYVYALAFNPQDRNRVYDDTVTRAQLGAAHDAIVWDWRAREVVAMDDAWTLQLGPEEWVYRVLCPISPSGIALVGDPDVFATAGTGRIHAVEAVDGGVRARVVGAPGEVVALVGVTPSGRVDLEVEIPARGWTPVTLTA